MELEAITPGSRIEGLVPGEVVTVKTLERRGKDVLSVLYGRASGGFVEELIYRQAAADLTLLESVGRPFTAPGAEFRMAAEAQRIRLAGRFDPFLAVSTSDVRPLPHQLRAVFQVMLDKVPLRFLLADDPGAGKTIMAGLLIKQLSLRSDVQRCLVVAPGGLVEQWQDELLFKFGLNFELLTNDRIQASIAQSVFERHPFLIARMDQLARNEDLLELLGESSWDLIIVDEAHRMSARYDTAHDVRRTQRFQLGELLRERTRHFLLMTATPHSGKEDDFQLFCTLLDPDLFEGRASKTLVTPNQDSFMLRRVKEDLLTFEGKPLFPERIAQTVEYELSTDEQYLYDKVTDYVRTEMNRADRLDGKRRNAVGFALTILQRRLASSPEAIYQSLVRRTERLRRRRDDVVSGRAVEDTLVDEDYLDDDEHTAEEREQVEETVLDSATSARTVAELDAELATLAELTALALKLRLSGKDVKWQSLSEILQNETLDAGGATRKLIIFTEHRDTLDYLQRKVQGLVGHDREVVAIHGGVSRVERRRITEEFTQNPDCQYLVATDAAGEGLNLQAAHLMVNYDLPWNPNRIEQRFGRVHRIGQEEVCRLWNLVAVSTREGDVYATLLVKLEQMRTTYGGRVFDVLGEAFNGSLKDVMMEAIRYGEQPEVRAKNQRIVDEAVSVGIPELLRARDLSREKFGIAELDDLHRQLEEARLRRLVPHYIEQAFRAAFTKLGGSIARRESGRFEISHVPAELRTKGTAVATRYGRVTFEIEHLEVDPELPKAQLLAPGHPLHDAVMDRAVELWGGALAIGATLVSATVPTPQLLLGLEEQISDADGEVIERRFRYVFVDESGTVRDAGPAPHLDMVACPETPVVERLRRAKWLPVAEKRAVDWLVGDDLPGYLDHIRSRRAQELDRLETEVSSRLSAVLNNLAADAAVASEKVRHGQIVRRPVEGFEQKISEIEHRLNDRMASIARQRSLRTTAPRVTMAALVVPQWMLDGNGSSPKPPAKDTEAVELRAVAAVVAAEKALGRVPVVMDHWNEGYDIESVAADQRIFIEVKGRIAGSTDFEVSRSEVMKGLNAAPNYRLALVRVDPDDPSADEVRYIADPFSGMDLGDFDATTITGHWAKTWVKGTTPW